MQYKNFQFTASYEADRAVVSSPAPVQSFNSQPHTRLTLEDSTENLEAVENFKGSRLEKLAVLYCKQLGINYKNLSDEEFRWLIRILQKSKKTGTPINQRKKR